MYFLFIYSKNLLLDIHAVFPSNFTPTQVYLYYSNCFLRHYFLWGSFFVSGTMCVCVPRVPSIDLFYGYLCMVGRFPFYLFSWISGTRLHYQQPSLAPVVVDWLYFVGIHKRRRRRRKEEAAARKAIGTTWASSAHFFRESSDVPHASALAKK